MPDKIHLLPDSVANQIAAGEVIQRPASVIKELVENAVDAGADDIRIFIKDAGRTLIQVIDNGSGMSETDARMAFERHATSKISSASDLASLHTMGFRGEALPSICAISQVELRSKTPSAAVGTHLVISGSRVELQEPDVCDKGTNIMVKNLFYNVPARRKFLKSDSVELSNIMREFERLALVNPEVRMSIDTGGKTISLRKGTMLQRIGEIWKGNLVQQLIPVDVDTPTVRISGFVTRPEFARRRNALQYFLVNGRNMRHPYFKKAVLNCFNGLIAPETMPCFFIKFDIDPAAIDVNIHPTKDEIKFEEETVIWSLLTAAVKGSLGKNAAVPSIDFDSQALPVVTPPKSSDAVQLPSYDIPADYNPFGPSVNLKGAPSHHATSRGDISAGHRAGKQPKDWEKLYEGFLGGGNTSDSQADSESLLPPEPDSVPSPPALPQFDSLMPELDHSLQFDEKYIIASIEGRGIVIVDQHRAHVKILYEQLMLRLNSEKSVSQSLLFPALLEISAEQEETLQEASETLRRLGMHIEKEGPDYVITGTPPGVSTDAAADIVARVLESLAEGASHYGTESVADAADALRRKVALSMARSMAVKRGRALSDEERGQLLKDLFSLPDPSLSPTGRRIFTLLDPPSIRRLLP